MDLWKFWMGIGALVWLGKKWVMAFAEGRFFGGGNESSEGWVVGRRIALTCGDNASGNGRVVRRLSTAGRGGVGAWVCFLA